MDTYRKEVNRPLLIDGKYFIDAVNVFVGLISLAARAERELLRSNLKDLFGDQLRSAMKLPPA